MCIMNHTFLNSINNLIIILRYFLEYSELMAILVVKGTPKLDYNYSLNMNTN